MNSTKKIVMTSMFAALCCVATMLIKIPSPLKGYLNIGDCVVLLSGFMLPPLYGFMAAGFGSALADILSGYVIYAPATFIIKGAMALVVHFGFKLMGKKCKNIFAQFISAALAEALMAIGYYTFEGFLYGFIPSLVNVPANIIQGAVGLITGFILIKIFEKHNITL